MGPFLSVLIAAFAAAQATQDVAPAAPLGPGDVRGAVFFAGVLVFLAAAGGQAQAGRRLRLNLSPVAVGGFERLVDLVGYFLLLSGTRFPALMQSVVPGVVGDMAFVFLPYFATAAARFAAALRIDLGSDGSAVAYRSTFTLFLRMTATPVLPVLVINAFFAWADATPAYAVPTAAYPTLQLLGSVVVVFAAAALSPLFMRALFAAERLPPGELRGDCEALAQRTGFPVDYLGRVRTGGMLLNAVYVGLVRPFRTVLFTDALIRDLSRQERLAVFAHELGHGARRHLVFFSGYIAVVTSAAYAFAPDLASLGAWMAKGGVAVGMPAADAQTAAGVIVTLLSAVLLLGALYFLFGFVSRRFETEADLFAADAVGDPEAFVTALQTVGARHGDAAMKDGFRHFGVPRRVEIVRRAATDPAYRAGFARLFRSLRLALIFAAVLTAARLWVAFPAERAAAPGRATASLMEFFDDAMRTGDYKTADSYVTTWRRDWPKGDPVGDFNRLHADAQLASIDLSLPAESFREIVGAFLAGHRVLDDAITRGELAVTPESKVQTDREVRFVAALAGLESAEFDLESFPAARILAALRGGPDVVSIDETRRAWRELETDDVWRKEALDRLGDVRAALAARYDGIWNNEGG